MNLCKVAWPLALPMFHFLHGKAAPFTPVKPDINHTIPDWWGEPPLTSAIDKFKKCFQENNTL